MQQLLITGTHKSERPAFNAEADHYLWVHGYPTRVIAGGAAGVDTQARRWAHSRGIPFLEVPVSDDDWRVIGKGAGFLRNKVMVDMCEPTDHCLAFPARGGSPGTLHCAGLAIKKGMLCYVLDLDRPYVFDPQLPQVLYA